MTEKTPDELRAARIEFESDQQAIIAESNRVKAELETQRFGRGDQGCGQPPKTDKDS